MVGASWMTDEVSTDEAYTHGLAWDHNPIAGLHFLEPRAEHTAKVFRKGVSMHRIIFRLR